MLRIAGKTDVGKSGLPMRTAFLWQSFLLTQPTQWSAMELGGEMAGHVASSLRRGADPKDGRGRLPGGF